MKINLSLFHLLALAMMIQISSCSKEKELIHSVQGENLTQEMSKFISITSGVKESDIIFDHSQKKVYLSNKLIYMDLDSLNKYLKDVKQNNPELLK